MPRSDGDGLAPAGKTSRTRVRGYAPWKPQAANRALLRQVDEVLVGYRDHLPLTLRQVFYRLVGAHGSPKQAAVLARLRDRTRAGATP